MSKTKQKSINPKHEGNLCDEITISFIEGEANVVNYLTTFPLFKIYLKSQLQGKILSQEKGSELTLMNKKYKLHFTNVKFNNSNNINTNTNTNDFYINSDTNIIFDISKQQIDLLSKELEQSLTLDTNTSPTNDERLLLTEENKQHLKDILTNKLNIIPSLIPTDTTQQQHNIELLTYNNIYTQITSLIDFQLLSPNNASPTYTYKGILLSGIPGIGKTHLITYLKQNYISSHSSEITHFEINIHKHFLDKDKALTYLSSIFKFAKLLSPSIIIFENLDHIFPKDDNNKPEEQPPFEYGSLLSFLINEIDSLPSNVLLITSCQNVSKVNYELTKYGRIDYHIQLPPPNANQRLHLIEHSLNDFTHSLTKDNIESLSDKTHGFVAGDIQKLFKDVYITCKLNNTETLTLQIIESHLSNIKPINLKDIIIDIPKVSWNEIGGNKRIIQSIRQSIEWPLKNPNAFKRLGITPPNGTLLYGPPGCSKTLIAKALANEAGLNFFAIKGPELFSKYVGDTEKAVRDIFKKAKLASPSIIFFDEIDSMASQRGGDGSGVEDKVLCQLLNEMDGIESREKVVIFGATNRPEILDKALIRPGRFDRLIYIPPPDKESREEIFNIVLSKMKIENGIDMKELSDMTEMFSGADIAKVAREAGMNALSEDIDIECIRKEHIMNAIKNTKPIITKDMIEYYEQFAKKSNEQ